MLIVDGVELVDVREAAHLVGRTPETVRRWIWSGRLTARKSGNRLLVEKAALFAGATGDRQQEVSLAAWAASRAAPRGTRGASAADLVLSDRAARSGAHGRR